MDNTESKWVPYQCRKLGALAHANVEYFHGKKVKCILGFKCDRVADCGIRLSPFSHIPIYSFDCPLYITLEKKLNRHRPKQD